MHTDGIWFKDEDGRTLLLRGANLGSTSKLPTRPNGATYSRDGFFDHRDVSFVGRPFPLEEADEHFRRLQAWGLTFLRLLVTWEAIEHAGPGQYDQEYLSYVRAIVEKAAEYGIDCFIDPHQDVWSRWTGGDGAPGWIFNVIGMDITRLDATGAAFTHQVQGDPFPRMVWPSNYSRLGAATMFTLFFGGNDFAPATLVDGEPIQEYLQRHYIDSIVQVARRLHDLPNVVGYDTLNEPGFGYIGHGDLNEVIAHALVGPLPTAFQGMLLGAGYPLEVPVWETTPEGARQIGVTQVNPDGLSVWRDGAECIWKQNGVWSDAGGTPPTAAATSLCTRSRRPCRLPERVPQALRATLHRRDPCGSSQCNYLPRRRAWAWAPAVGCCRSTECGECGALVRRADARNQTL